MGPQGITRVDQETTLTIQANLKGRSMEDVQGDITGVLDKFNLPAGYSWKLGRGFETQDDLTAANGDGHAAGGAVHLHHHGGVV